MRAPRPQFLDQPALADAGLARHERELRAAAPGRAPERREPRALGRPADERRPGGRRRAAARSVRLGVDQQQRLVRRPGRGRRLDAQLALQRGGVRVVDPQRPRPVAARVVEAHEHPVAVLTQRVGADEPLRAADRRRPVLALLELPLKALERVEVAIAQPLALVEGPVLVVALQEVAGVRVDRRPQATAGERPLEVLEVEPVGRVRPPAQRAGGHLDETLGVGQPAPERVEHVAEVGARLPLGRIGPQQEREPLAGLRHAAMHEQVPEQRHGPRGLERR